MGVPGLFAYLSREYPSAFVKSQSTTPRKFDAVYLDGNALLYPISAETKDPAEIAKMLLIVAQQYGATHQCMCHIYIDGAAHMGKIKQQRARRFGYEPVTDVSVNIQDVGDGGERTSYETYTWTRAMFTPGTEMMRLIDEYVVAHMRDTRYPNIGTYSSYREPGEGEHKLIRDIRELHIQHREIGIVGKDADLILLGMGLIERTNERVIPMILRHDDFAKPDGFKATDPLYYIDCATLKKAITGDSIWNFIIATFFMGNDFTYSIPEIGDIRNAMPRVLDILRKNRDLLYRNGNIHWDGMIVFIEEYLMVNTIVPTIWKNAVSTVNGAMTSSVFDPLYYFHVSPFVVDRTRIVLSWMITIQWIFHYYHDGLDAASIAWQYPAYFPPTLFTLLEIMPTMLTGQNDVIGMISSIAREKLTYLTPIQALAGVLPIWLHDLVPDVDGIRQSLEQHRQYYPYSFNIQDELKEPIIPIIPYSVLKTL